MIETGIVATTKAVGGISIELRNASHEGLLLHKHEQHWGAIESDMYSIEISKECFDVLKKLADRDNWVYMTVNSDHFREADGG